MLRKWRDAGLHLRIATSAIGMVGYYSRMELIDLTGLTDRRVARQKLKRRGRPGHERHTQFERVKGIERHGKRCEDL
jgi:hypothetical protein